MVAAWGREWPDPARDPNSIIDVVASVSDLCCLLSPFSNRRGFGVPRAAEPKASPFAGPTPCLRDSSSWTQAISPVARSGPGAHGIPKESQTHQGPSSWNSSSSRRMPRSSTGTL